MPSQDDWRRQGQEKYLKGETLYWKSYTKYNDEWDHDHCEFCGTKFMDIEDPQAKREGYATKDNYRWICKECFDDFKDEYEWKIESNAL